MIIKKEAVGEYGKKPEDRTTKELFNSGIINLDKPAGPTSHLVVQYVKEILNVKKAGHSGTLDPKVTGILPIAINNGTKVLQALLKSDKEYVCLMHIHKDVKEAKIKKIFKRFKGEIEQVPPLRSNVKRVKRKRMIYSLKIKEIKDRDVLFTVSCQAGTYIRKLVYDMGKELGVGANMQELRRIKTGPFTEQDSVILQDLSDAMEKYKQGKEKLLRQYIKPIESAVKHLRKIWILDSTVDSLCYGAKLKVPGISKLEDGIDKGDIIAVLTLKDELVILGKAEMSSKEMKTKKKGVACSILRCIMERGTYPNLWQKKSEKMS